MDVKHDTCLYKVDHIYLDQASYNLYTLFLHCKWCGKPIKLVLETEHNIVKWLGGIKGKWIPTPDDFAEFKCSVCDKPNFWEDNFCPNCGADMRGDDNG